MSTFDQKAFEHLKKLCRIECSPEEQEEILASLQKVLSYVHQLEELDTKNVAPCNYVLRTMAKNRTREDVPKELFSRDQFLANAPDQIGGMVRVPPVLKEP